MLELNDPEEYLPHHQQKLYFLFVWYLKLFLFLVLMRMAKSCGFYDVRISAITVPLFLDHFISMIYMITFLKASPTYDAFGIQGAIEAAESWILK